MDAATGRGDEGQGPPPISSLTGLHGVTTTAEVGSGVGDGPDDVLPSRGFVPPVPPTSSASAPGLATGPRVSDPPPTTTEATGSLVDDKARQAELLRQQQDEIAIIKQQLAALQRRNVMAEMSTQTEVKEEKSGDLSDWPRGDTPPLVDPPKQPRPPPKATAAAPQTPRGGLRRLTAWSCPLAQTFQCRKVLPIRRGATPIPLETASITRLGMQVVLFGGTNGTHISNDVWLFEPAVEQWRKAKVSGDVPLGRYGHTAVTYRKRLLVFGGYGLGGSPTPLRGGRPAMMSDGAGGGGGGGVPYPLLSSTMVGYTTQWMQSERGYDAIRCGLLCSLYAFDPTTFQWQELPNTGPQQVYVKNHSAVVHGSAMVVFGGCTPEGRTNVVKAFDLEGQRWLPEEGLNPQLLNYRLAGGHAASVDMPCPRSGHTAVVHKDARGRHCMVVFGGRVSKFSYCNDSFSYNFETHLWQPLPCDGAIPPPRAGHTAVVHKNSMVVFGGYCYPNKHAKVYYNDIHVLNFSDLTWRKASVAGHLMPYGRCGHVATTYEGPDRSIRMLVFGGWGEHSVADPSHPAAAAPPMDDVGVTFAPNNDTFSFTLALPVAPVAPVSPRKKAAPPVKADEAASSPRGDSKAASSDQEREDKDPADASQSPRKKKALHGSGSKPTPFSVSTSKPLIPPIPPPMAKQAKALPKKHIEKVVLRLANTEQAMRLRDKLNRKYLVEHGRLQLTANEQEECIERLYYQQMEVREHRQQQMEPKREEGRLMDEDEWYEVIERLTAVRTPKEEIAEPPHRITKETENTLVDRLYNNARDQQLRAQVLHRKYYTEEPSVKKSQTDLDNMVQRLYDEPLRGTNITARGKAAK